MLDRSKRMPYERNLTYGLVDKIGPGAYKENPVFSAACTNLSDGGIHVVSNAFLSEGERVTLIVSSGNELLRVTGGIAWVKRATPGAMPYTKHQMGIQFEHVSHRIIDFYNDMMTSGFGCLASEV